MADLDLFSTPCPCGKPWNLAAYDPLLVDVVAALIDQLGPLIPVRMCHKAWRVSRACIAFHGITGQQLLSGRSGFEEIDPCSS